MGRRGRVPDQNERRGSTTGGTGARGVPGRSPGRESVRYVRGSTRGERGRVRTGRARPFSPYPAGGLGRLAVSLAVQTGVSYREWLRDPAAMITAQEVLAEMADEMEKRTR